METVVSRERRATEVGHTSRVTRLVGPQAAVAARLPGAASLGLVAPPSAAPVPATELARPDSVGQFLAARALTLGTTEPRVTATVWWYSASAVLLAPPLAGTVTGVPLSARLADLTVSYGPGGLPVAATSSAPGGDLAGELRATLGAVIAAVATAGRMRTAPLWAIATDSLAGTLLAVGRATGAVQAATALAAPLATAVGRPLPVPRYVDVGRTRFVRRASCCLVYRVPGGSLCTSCPRRPPVERARLLSATAARG